MSFQTRRITVIVLLLLTLLLSGVAIYIGFQVQQDQSTDDASANDCPAGDFPSFAACLDACLAGAETQTETTPAEWRAGCPQGCRNLCETGDSDGPGGTDGACTVTAPGGPGGCLAASGACTGYEYIIYTRPMTGPEDDCFVSATDGEVIGGGTIQTGGQYCPNPTICTCQQVDAFEVANGNNFIGVKRGSWVDACNANRACGQSCFGSGQGTCSANNTCQAGTCVLNTCADNPDNCNADLCTPIEEEITTFTCDDTFTCQPLEGEGGEFSTAASCEEACAPPEPEEVQLQGRVVCREDDGRIYPLVTVVVSVTRNGSEVTSVTTNAQGSWQVTDTDALDNGSYGVSLTQLPSGNLTTGQPIDAIVLRDDFCVSGSAIGCVNGQVTCSAGTPAYSACLAGPGTTLSSLDIVFTNCTPLAPATCGETCETSDQCPFDHVCSNGVCTLEACVDNDSCTDNGCRLPETAIYGDERDLVVFGIFLALLGFILYRIGVTRFALLGVKPLRASLDRGRRTRNVLQNKGNAQRKRSSKVHRERKDFERRVIDT